LEKFIFTVSESEANEFDACKITGTLTVVPAGSPIDAPGTLVQLLNVMLAFCVDANPLPPILQDHPVGPVGIPVVVSVNDTCWDIRTLFKLGVNEAVKTGGKTFIPLTLLKVEATPIESVTVKLAVYDPGFAYETYAVAPVAEEIFPPVKFHNLE
jgi:hypothetical protein